MKKSANVSMNSIISDDAIYRACVALAESTFIPHYEFSNMFAELGNQLVHPKHGKITKRIAKWTKRNRDVVINSDLLSQVGKILSESCGDRSFHVAILDGVSFRPGVFGDDDACFFVNSQHYSSHYRRILQLMDAHAVCIFESGKPIARAWLLPESDDSYLLINLYVAWRESMSLRLAAELLTGMLGLHTVKECHYGSGNLYINNNNAIRISDSDCGNDSYLEQPYCDIEHDECISCRNCGELSMDGNEQCSFCGDWIDLPDSKKCYCCGDHISDDDSIYHNGDRYCSECYCESFFECSCCGGTHYNEDGIWIESEESMVCSWCYRQNYRSCDHCGNDTRREELVSIHNEDLICPDCIRSEFVRCEHCGEYHHHESIKYVESRGSKKHAVCLDCLRSLRDHGHVKRCKLCGVLHYSSALWYGRCFSCVVCAVGFYSCRICGCKIYNDDMYDTRSVFATCSACHNS